MPLDPLDRLDLDFGGGLASSQPSVTSPRLDKLGQQSLGSSLLGASKGALQSLLETLGRPRRAVMGVLSGKPREALALNPYSDVMGWTNPKDEVTGRKLMENMGVVRHGDKGWGSWGLGLGADIALDPLTYATFGPKHALTAGGRALSKAGELKGWSRRELLEGFHDTESNLGRLGHTSDYISHLRDQGQRIASPAAEAAYSAATGQPLIAGQGLSNLVRFSVPFRPDLGFGLGSGGTAQAVAGGLDRAARWIKFGNPLGRQVNSLFDYSVNRGIGQHTQEAWHDFGEPYQKELQAQARGREYRIGSRLDQLIRANPDREADILRAARINAETSSPLAYLRGGDPMRAQFLDDTRTIGMRASIYPKWWLEERQNAGLRTKMLEDKYTKYVPREATSAYNAGSAQQLERGTVYPVVGRNDLRRKKVFRDVPGGTDRLNDWVDRFAGASDLAAAGRAIHGDLLADFGHVTGRTPTAAEAAEFASRSSKTARVLSRLDAGKYLGKIDTNPFFSHDLAGDIGRYGESHARTMAGQRAIVHALASAARPIGELSGAAHVTAPEALRQMGLINRDTGSELIGAAPELYRRLAPKGAGQVEPLVTGAAPYGIHGELAKFGIPDNAWQDIRRSHARWVTPEEMIAPIKGVDTATNLFRGLAYPIWLASHVRNAATAAFNNARTGTKWADYARQSKLMRGKLPAAAADDLRRSQFSNARIFGANSPLTELSGRTAAASSGTSRRWNDFTPGTNQYGMGRLGPTGSLTGDTANLLLREGGTNFLRDVANKVRDWNNAPNPFQMAGTFGAKHDVFAPVVAGRKLSSNIEDFFRGAQYNGLVRQGYSPAEAAAQIRKYHFEYQDLSQFEKSWMRRLVPFYTFTRKNLPLQLETLATRPGAFSAPFAPTRVNRDKQEYVPDYLANGFAMPIGKEHEGTQRFITSLGLPQEEAFKEFSMRNGLPDLQMSGMRLMGNLNPLIKGPLEAMVDRQFFSGRKLSDLRPGVAGRGLAGLLSDDAAQQNELARVFTQGISNTPLTRFATTMDKLADTKPVTPEARKELWATGLNLLTGARLSDVDIERQKAFEVRDAMDHALANSPHIAKHLEYYVRPEFKKQLTPDELTEMRLYGTMQQKAREYMARKRMLDRQQGR